MICAPLPHFDWATTSRTLPPAISAVSPENLSAMEDDRPAEYPHDEPSMA